MSTSLCIARTIGETPFGPAAPRVAVVIPCYRVERHVAEVIKGVPPLVTLIVAVDDACPNGSARAIEELCDARVVLIRHEKNQGVGGAMMTGYRECLRRGYDIVVKMDGDGQMDAARLAALIKPLACELADYTKGNRWTHSASLVRMPWVRRIGNLGLSFLTKLASGHWKIFDPCNGFTAIHARALRQLPLDHLARDYFFEISVLVELGILGARVADVATASRYGDETSSLRVGRILRTFPHRLASSLVRRIWVRHFVREFGPVGLFLLCGGASVTWSTAFGAWAWAHSWISGVPATSGTVMLAALPFLMGFQLLLQALVMDITMPASGLVEQVENSGSQPATPEVSAGPDDLRDQESYATAPQRGLASAA